MLDRWLDELARDEEEQTKLASVEDSFANLSTEELMKLSGLDKKALAPSTLQLPTPPPPTQPGVPPVPEEPPAMPGEEMPPEEMMPEEEMGPETASEAVAEEAAMPLAGGAPVTPGQVGAAVGSGVATVMEMMGALGAGAEAMAAEEAPPEPSPEEAAMMEQQMAEDQAAQMQPAAEQAAPPPPPPAPAPMPASNPAVGGAGGMSMPPGAGPSGAQVPGTGGMGGMGMPGMTPKMSSVRDLQGLLQEKLARKGNRTPASYKARQHAEDNPPAARLVPRKPEQAPASPAGVPRGPGKLPPKRTSPAGDRTGLSPFAGKEATSSVDPTVGADSVKTGSALPLDVYESAIVKTAQAEAMEKEAENVVYPSIGMAELRQLLKTKLSPPTGVEKLAWGWPAALGAAGGLAGGIGGTLGAQKLMKERREGKIESALQQLPGPLGEFYLANPERRDEVADFMSRMPAADKKPMGTFANVQFAPISDEMIDHLEQLQKESSVPEVYASALEKQAVGPEAAAALEQFVAKAPPRMGHARSVAGDLLNPFKHLSKRKEMRDVAQHMREIGEAPMSIKALPELVGTPSSSGHLMTVGDDVMTRPEFQQLLAQRAQLVEAGLPSGAKINLNPQQLETLLAQRHGQAQRAFGQAEELERAALREGLIGGGMLTAGPLGGVGAGATGAALLSGLDANPSRKHDRAIARSERRAARAERKAARSQEKGASAQLRPFRS